MAIRQMNPYLTFNGTAEKALRLYENALGANIGPITRFGEMQGVPVEAEHKDRVIHAELRLGGRALMASDSMPGQPVAMEGNVSVALDFDDVAEMTKRFNALAEGGRITMPLQD